jgi:hypothetical protein
MADKHTLVLEILKEYGANLKIPREVEFTIVDTSPIDEEILEKFSNNHGFHHTLVRIDGVYLATLTIEMVANETTIPPLSKLVDKFCKEQGWDYSGWGSDV